MQKQGHVGVAVVRRGRAARHLRLQRLLHPLAHDRSCLSICTSGSGAAAGRGVAVEGIRLAVIDDRRLLQRLSDHHRHLPVGVPGRGDLARARWQRRTAWRDRGAVHGRCQAFHAHDLQVVLVDVTGTRAGCVVVGQDVAHTVIGARRARLSRARAGSLAAGCDQRHAVDHLRVQRRGRSRRITDRDRTRRLPVQRADPHVLDRVVGVHRNELPHAAVGNRVVLRPRGVLGAGRSPRRVVGEGGQARVVLVGLAGHGPRQAGVLVQEGECLAVLPRQRREVALRVIGGGDRAPVTAGDLRDHAVGIGEGDHASIAGLHGAQRVVRAIAEGQGHAPGSGQRQQLAGAVELLQRTGRHIAEQIAASDRRKSVRNVSRGREATGSPQEVDDVAVSARQRR